MPPTSRFVISFAAEPPQDALPSGRWADTLRRHFLAACELISSGDEELGDVGEISWYPDRTFDARTYIPATAPTSTGLEVFGFVSFHDDPDGGPDDFGARADFTGETAERNPDWRLDLCDEVVGRWRGEDGDGADMTLIWGRPLIDGGDVVTAELADLAVDQCALLDGRFTLLAPDSYHDDYLVVKLFDRQSSELAQESLYVEDEDEEDEGSGDGEAAQQRSSDESG